MQENRLSTSRFADALISPGKSSIIPEEYNYFGKLVGEWDFVNIFDEGRKKVHGEWIFTWVLEGTAIQDLFISPSREERAKTPLAKGDYSEYGTSLRFYNPATKAWDVFYGNCGTAAVRLQANREGDSIVLTEITEKKMKWVFSEITDTTFHWQFVVFNAQGAWEVQGDLRATRRL